MYLLIPAKLINDQIDDEPCYCTPKCERDVYRSTISQAVLSKAMLKAFYGMDIASPYSRSANRLDDYVIMYTTNTSWASTLYRLSIMYRNSRDNILDIATNVEMFRAERIRANLEQSTKLCIETVLCSITNITSQFVAWEKSTFYLNISSTLYSENFISHMANDMVRGLEQLDNFASGLMRHLELIRIAAGRLPCNDTSLITFLKEIEIVTNQANDSFCGYYEEYKLFSHTVKTHQRIKSYQVPVEDSLPEYIRWEIISIRDKSYYESGICNRNRTNGICRLKWKSKGNRLGVNIPPYYHMIKI